MRTNFIKEKMAQGKAVLGPFCKMTDAAVYEIAGLAGFDFAIIDMEHGPIGYETAQNLVRACELSGISPIIRVPANEPHVILRALDIGAHGVEVPEINCKADAQKLAEAARYYPKGNRGVCRFVRNADYSDLPKAAYFDQANERTLVIAHLEGKEGLENLDEIMEVDGIDVLFIGPYDLSQSLGIPGQTTHPKLIAAMEEIVSRAKAKGKQLGTFVESVEAAKRWREKGVAFLSYSVDVSFLMESFKTVTNAFHQEE